ncbi:hypothetical protein IH992_00610 [Candidatus Poribacteria bacterium]|nr:hypothetical protein [Candidatus Poribacteria bacterium]
MEDKQQYNQMQDLSLNFISDSLLALTDKIKSGIEGRMDWGDTFGIGLGTKHDKYLLVWTPKESSEGQILPGFDSEDGKLTLKMKSRPGAWVSWIDEAKVTAEATDDYDRVRKSVQELERNTRQIIDFADGVLKDIRVQHLGKLLTLPELAQEILQVELTIPNTVKTGGYILAHSKDEIPVAKVIIPEQTNIHRVHLNEDELFDAIAKDGYDLLLVVFRTHIKNYPDLVDINYCLTLDDYFRGNSQQEEIVSNTPSFNLAQDGHEIKILPTATVYNPLHPDITQFVPVSFTAPAEQIREAISQCSSEIDRYVSQANQYASEIMTDFQQRIDSRMHALIIQPGQRIHEKVWDDLAVQELRNRLLEFTEFFGKYLSENFPPDAAELKKNQLHSSIDPLIESWQISDLRQTTLQRLILSGYKLANQMLDLATGMHYDLAFEKYFIEPGLIQKVEFLALENGELVNEVHLPEWTKKTVGDLLHRFALNSAVHSKQIERLRTLWLESLEVANFASQHNQEFETIVEPLVNLLISPSATNTLPRTSRQSKPAFNGFEIPDGEFQRILTRIKDNFSLIKRCILNAPKERDKLAQYYSTLWMILIDGKVREMLFQNVQPIWNINLSTPLETKRLIDLVLSGEIVVRDEKDLQSLKRNLERALRAKVGKKLQEITTPSMLEIHGDTLLCMLRDELLAYQAMLEKRLARITHPKVQKKQAKMRKGRKKKTSPESVEVELQSIEMEKPKIAEIIEFLAPYAEAPSVLIEASINPQSAQLDEIRRRQVLNFDLQELPPIEKTWLENIKTVDDYPNLRALLLENKLSISTTGRLLMDLRRTFPDTGIGANSANAFNVVLELVQELRALQDAGYDGQPLERFIDYLPEKLWRWELTQITNEELPTLIKEKVLVSAVCYEKEVEALLEYVERYDQLLEKKFVQGSEVNKQRGVLEEKFQAIAETIL